MTSPPTNTFDTEFFLAQIAGGLSADFPDDIDASDLTPDTARETLE